MRNEVGAASVSLAGSAGVAIPGGVWALDWGVAMGISVARFATRRVGVCADGLAQVREFTRRQLAGWGLDGGIDDVVSVVGELTANVVCHAAAEEGGVWLALATSPRSVICVVRDPSSQTPVPRASVFPAVDGRGLGIVAALSCAWGWRTEADGKAVWARIPL